MGDMATTVRADSETDGPRGSQACKTLTDPLFPTPGLWMGTFPQALNLAGMSWEVDRQAVQTRQGRSWLTHAGVVFESPKEGKRQEWGIPIPGPWFLEWLDSSRS